MQTRTHIGQISVSPEELEAIASGAKRHVFVPARMAPINGDTIVVSGLTGAVLIVRVTKVISAQEPCALSPEGQSPDYTSVSIEVVA